MSWTELYPQDRDRPRVPERPVVERKPLNVVLPCWKGDQNQARMLLEWIGELGMVQAPFWLACSRECNVEQLMGLARKAFSVVKWINDGEGMISNWNEVGDHPKSAAGPNSLFRQIAWTFALPPKGPWLFLEPDAIVCRRDWYDLIAREYDVGGRPFMGYQVNPVNHPGVPPHMSGVGVYPQNTPSIAPKAVDPSDVAFDIAGVEQIFPNAHFTNLIYHKYRAPGFTSEEDFNARVNPEVAIWHACKDGSIYQFLRKRLGIVQDLPAPPVPVAQRIELPSSIRKAEGSTPSGHVWEFKGGQLAKV